MKFLISTEKKNASCDFLETTNWKKRDKTKKINTAIDSSQVFCSLTFLFGKSVPSSIVFKKLGIVSYCILLKEFILAR